MLWKVHRCVPEWGVPWQQLGHGGQTRAVVTFCREPGTGGNGIKGQLLCLVNYDGWTLTAFFSVFLLFFFAKMEMIHRSHSEHLVTNGVHKSYYFENINLRWLVTNYFEKQIKLIFVYPNRSGIFWEDISSVLWPLKLFVCLKNVCVFFYIKKKAFVTLN